MHQTLQARMFQEMKQKDIFRQAGQYTFAYAVKAFVTAGDKALQELRIK